MASPVSQGADLEQLARARFDRLSEAEIKLIRAAATGTVTYCGSEARDDPANDPAQGGNWGPERQVRAALIRWLCTDGAAERCVDVSGIRISGASISESLGLAFALIRFPLALFRCRVDGELKLNAIQIPALSLKGSWIKSLDAEGAVVRGTVSLSEGFKAERGVKLRGMQIGGDLICDGGTFYSPAQAGVTPSGVALASQGSTVTGNVRLSRGFLAKGLVTFFGARIGGTFNCEGATIENPAQERVENSGTTLNAEGAVVGGAVLLRKAFTSKGGVRLFRIQIGASLECDGGAFDNPPQTGVSASGVSLDIEGANITGAVLLRNGFSAKGMVRLYASKIGENLDCQNASFENPAQLGVEKSGLALNAESAKITGAALLRNGFRASGGVRFYGAYIGSNLTCTAGRFENPPERAIEASGIALNVEGATIGNNVLLNNKFASRGQVRLYGAQIQGMLHCDGGNFINPPQAGIPQSGLALVAGNAQVGNEVYLRNGFSATGEVVFSGAQIEGTLNCDGARLENPPIEKSGESTTSLGGGALSASGAKVTGAVLLRRGFQANGTVNLFAAQIGGNLECDGGTFKNPLHASIPTSGTAIHASNARITGAALFQNGFAAHGAVRLYFVHVDGDLSFAGGKIENPPQTGVRGSGTALNAQNARVTGAVLLNRKFASIGRVELDNARIGGRLETDGGTLEVLDLTDASAAAIVDDESGWPEAGNLLLDGFVYHRISGGPADVSTRLKWLGRQDSFTRQPYRQLAKVLRDAGDDPGWRRVCVAMERKAWKGRHWSVRPIDYLLRWTIGYGYFSGRAVQALCALVILGTIVYSLAYSRKMIVPTQEDAYSRFQVTGYPPEYYQRFHALPYSLENSFPVVKLGIQERWSVAQDRPANAKSGLKYFPRRIVESPAFLQWFKWLQVCTGWILTTLFVGGVTGLIRKE